MIVICFGAFISPVALLAFFSIIARFSGLCSALDRTLVDLTFVALKRPVKMWLFYLVFALLFVRDRRPLPLL